MWLLHLPATLPLSSVQVECLLLANERSEDVSWRYHHRSGGGGLTAWLPCTQVSQSRIYLSYIWASVVHTLGVDVGLLPGALSRLARFGGLLFPIFVVGICISASVSK
jgi:hypothetical protein